MAFIEIENLSFTYENSDHPALSQVNLSVKSGEFVLVCGASGCGKSTLLRQLKPALRPHGKLSGSIRIDGRPIDEFDLRQQAADIGFVMQDSQMQIVTDKVWHELAFGLENLGYDQRLMRLRIAEISCFFGIQNWFDTPTSALSGGQKQLLCLACAAVMQPKLLLLDEPTSQLDPIAAGEFINTLKRLNEEMGITVIITEHRIEALSPIADRVVFLKNGEVAADCFPCSLVDCMNINNELYEMLPTALKIYSKTRDMVDCSGAAPLTVREGRDYLELIYGGDRQRGGECALGCAATLESDTPLISVKNAWFRYARNLPDVLRGLDFKAYANEITCVLGGNGAGKTTALMVAAGLYKPYRGKVIIFGKEASSYKAGELYGKRIGVLPQNPRDCFVKDTVIEDLEDMAAAFHCNADRINEVSDLMHISNILHKHPYDISGGEQQRAAIAKLLLPSPDVLFLDEPTKGMDAVFKIKFGRILRELANKGIAVILISHDVEFCAEYADKCAFCFEGRITAEGTPREVFSENAFYTTSARRISRGFIENAITADEIIESIIANLGRTNGRNADR